MEQGPLVEIGLPLALFIIMVGMGMTLTAGEFRKVAVYPRGMILGSIAQIVLLPLIAFGLVWLLDLPPAIAVGLVVIAACPGGTTSNLFTFVARGNVALSIVLTVVASLVTIISLPLFTNYALGLYMGADEWIRLPVLQTIATLVVIVLIPVAIGMWIRSKAPQLASRAEGPVGLFGMLVLAGLIVALVLQVGDEVGSLLRQAGPAAILLNVAGILLGLLGGRLGGLNHADALTVAVELGVKNGTLGLLVTLTLLESSVMSIPSAVYSLFMFAFGFLLVGYGRLVAGRLRQAAAQPAGAGN